MPKVTEQDFEFLSEQIVDDFVAEGTPLNASISKIASEKGLLPDQIRQLAWRTNIKTHLNLFEKKSGDDKIIEFPLANASEIIKNVYESSRDSSEEASSEQEKVAFELDFYQRPDPLEVFEKVAAEEPSASDLEKMAYRQKVQNERATELLTQEVLGAREAYIECLEDLAKDLKKLADHPDSDEHVIPDFVHEAVSVYGAEIKPIIADLGLTVSESMLKTATFADVNTPYHLKLQEAKLHFDHAIKSCVSLKLLEKKAKLN